MEAVLPFFTFAWILGIEFMSSDLQAISRAPERVS